MGFATGEARGSNVNSVSMETLIPPKAIRELSLACFLHTQKAEWASSGLALTGLCIRGLACTYVRYAGTDTECEVRSPLGYRS